MTIAAAAVNMILGAVYVSYGVMTMIDMKREWRTSGFSHFGAAWILMTLTCGPHHLDHGIHLLIDKTPGGALDLTAVLVGFPAGVTWFLLRVEAFRGGAGDRLIRGTPRWLAAIPILALGYTVWIGVLLGGYVRAARFWSPTVAANVLLIILYCVIGLVLLRTQFHNRPGAPGWSVSGLSLGVVFPTCAIMHAVHTAYTLTGAYHFDQHVTIIDWLGVPAAAYFLWIVKGLYAEALRDWNRQPERAAVLAG